VVGGSVIVSADVQPELVRPDHVALLMSEREALGVVDELANDLDVLARITDVVDGMVLVFSAALKGDECVFRGALDDVEAWLATLRRSSTGCCLF
jgi:hypothetical protein